MLTQRRKVLAKNLVSLVIVIIVPIIILNIYYITYWSNNMKELEIEKDVKFLSLMGQTLDTILNDITQLVSLLEFDHTFNNAIDGLIEEDGNLSPSRFIYLNSVMENTFRTFLAKPYIRSVYFYHEHNDRIVFTTEGIKNVNEMIDSGWLESYRMNANERNYWIEVRNVEYPGTRVVETLTLFRKVPIYVTQPGQGVGVIVLNLETKYFDSLTSNIPDTQDKTIFIMDSASNVLYNNSGEALSDFLSMDDLANLSEHGHMVKKTATESYLVSYVEAKHYDWRYISVFPTKKLTERLDFIKQINIWILVFSFLVGILLAYRYTMKSYKPVRTLLEVIRYYNEGKDLSGFKLTKDDEYGYITLHIIRNFIEKNEIQQSLIENTLLQRETELFALQAQINPHFLYNMLETINWEAIDRLGKDNAVSAMLLQLSHNLRYVTDHSRYIVTVEKDLQHLEQYVYMQQAMKEDLFKFEVDADESALHAQTLKLLMQPLVENSIQHGMSGKNAGGWIRVKIRRIHQHLEIRIADNGNGIARDKLLKLQSELAQPKPQYQYSKGLGVLNIHQRIRLRFGDQYGLQIRSKTHWGTIVVMTFPYMKD